MKVSIVNDIPHVPPRLFEAPSTTLQKEVERDRAEVERYAKAVLARQQDVHANVAELHRLEDELAAEVQRGAQAGKPNAERETELAFELEKTKATCTDEFHGPRLEAAWRAYHDALATYESNVRANLVDLIEEAREEAEAISTEWENLHQEILAPVEQRHRQMQTQMSALVGYQTKRRRSLVPRGHAPYDPSHWSEETVLTIPTNYAQAPIPTREQVAEYEEWMNPKPSNSDNAAEVAAA